MVLEVKAVSKVYRLYDRPADRLFESLGLARGRHKDHHALREVSFMVARGEIVGIIGVNGSGKSTLLKIITGVLSPTSGSVQTEGRISALLELGAGFNPDYTGLENIRLSGTMMGYSQAEIERLEPEVVSFADIGDYIGQPVKTYSSGMFARLAFAVAINTEPDILIIDEALSVGDYFFQAKCYRKFEEFRAAGKTILFVSHDMGSVLKYCDRTILLHRGTLIAQGETKTVVDLYKKLLVRDLDAGEADRMAQGAAAALQTTAQVSQRPLRESMHINPDALKYGDQAADILDFGIRDEAGEITGFVRKFAPFAVIVRVRFARAVARPIVAYTVKDLKGTELFGTNTEIEGAIVPPAAAGDEIEVTFTQTMYLNGGNYLLSVGCTSYAGEELLVHHRLYDICSIDVVSDRTTVGYLDPGIQVEIRSVS